MSETIRTEQWFELAVPEPTQANRDCQIGCHAEEFVEMLDEMVIASAAGDFLLRTAKHNLHTLAEALKEGKYSVSLRSREKYLDSIADQIVTGLGCAHMHGMNGPEALARVNDSNFSKFDENGKPIFKPNGKIAKGPNYQEPDLEGLY